MTNPHARHLRERAAADRRRAAEVAIAMRTVGLSIDAEVARWHALRNERAALLAKAADAEDLARELVTSERGSA